MITSAVQDTPGLFNLYFCSYNLNAGLNTTKLSNFSVVINKSLTTGWETVHYQGNR